MTLYEVPDESEPWTTTELQDRGNRLLTDARKASVEALRASATTVGLRLGSYTVSDIRRFRAEARAATQAWQKVDGLLSELAREYDRARSR